MIYVVSSGRGFEQAFARLADAECFASENPDARITCNRVRQSMDEAVEIFDRRVYVARGDTVLDQTSAVHRFIDDPLDTPDPADVEWFPDDSYSGWHIAGFGSDKAALDAQVQRAIDRSRVLSHPSVMDAASGVPS
ncbi:MAG: hypothetical protein ACOH2Q_13460 [Rhodococcus sp. (in: high G+C Gram-positive bacteria)]